MKILFGVLVGVLLVSMAPNDAFNNVRAVIAQARLNEAEHKTVSESLKVLKALVADKLAKEKTKAEDKIFKDYLSKEKK